MTPDPRQSGRLEQVCPSPSCGMREAAGSYCSCCATRTGPADWFKPRASASQKAALDAARAVRHARVAGASPLEESRLVPARAESPVSAPTAGASARARNAGI